MFHLTAFSQNIKTDTLKEAKNINNTNKVAESESFVIIETKQGSTLMGKIIKEGNGKIVIKSDEMGEITILLDDIKSLEKLTADNFKKNKYWFENPHYSRYFFGPTARNLKKGEGYFQNLELILFSANYGITDNFSIGGGMSIIPGFEINEQIYFFQPKVGFQITESINAGGGIFVFGNSESFGNLFYGNSTIGNTDDNFTIGVGYGFIDDEFLETPILMLNGMKRVSPRIALISENWIFTEFQMISYGVRFFGKKISVDLALINSLQDLIFPGFPYVDFVFKF